jgi:hypothetical protein
MAYKTFVAGTEGLASDINTYLMNQSVMVFTNAAARTAAIASPTEGMVTYLTGNDHFAIYSGTEWVVWDLAWNSFTPTIVGLPTSSITGGYVRQGKVVHFYLYVVASGAATAAITFNLPLACNSITRLSLSGRMSVAGTTYIAYPIGVTTTTVGLYVMNAAGTYATVTNTSAIIPNTWALNSSFTIVGTYDIP